MDISALTLKLIVLLIPGVLATTIYKRLTIRHKEQSDFMFVIVSIMFGMFSYLALQIMIYVVCFFHNLFASIHRDYSVINTFRNLSDGTNIPYAEVIWSSIISIPLGFMVTYIDNEKFINRVAKRFRISNKYGDENLYTRFLNSPDLNWVYVRDIPNSLTYCGWVQFFSETQEFKEIVLSEVTVFNYPDSEELYKIDSIYLCLPIDRIIIEQAKLNQNGEEQIQ